MTNQNTIVVTRHPALVQFLLEQVREYAGRPVTYQVTVVG